MDLQLDVGWAVIGVERPAALLARFGDRIELLHVKDGADITSRMQTSVGQRIVDWAAIFRASHGHVNPIAVKSFEYVDRLVY